MRLLDRYIAKTVLASIGLVSLLLTGLQIFILFVNELDEIGKSNYGLLKTATFVLLQTPEQVYSFFPMASLLGCLLGLGVLANHNELSVMRAAGMSIGQIAWAMVKAALIVIVVISLIGELVVPKLTKLAAIEKKEALHGGQTIKTMYGIWLRQNKDFIFINTVEDSGRQLGGVQQFHFDNEQRLQSARRIKRITYQNAEWKAEHIEETQVTSDKIMKKTIPHMIWDINLNPNILSIRDYEPEDMSLWELHQYIKAQKLSYENLGAHLLAYWQRLIQPLATIVMMILAIPFIFGPLRSTTMGSKLVTGAIIGFGFYLINRFFAPVSQVLQWPPILAAVGPTCVFALLGCYLMNKVR